MTRKIALTGFVCLLVVVFGFAQPGMAQMPELEGTIKINGKGQQYGEKFKIKDKMDCEFVPEPCEYPISCSGEDGSTVELCCTAHNCDDGDKGECDISCDFFYWGEQDATGFATGRLKFKQKGDVEKLKVKMVFTGEVFDPPPPAPEYREVVWGKIRGKFELTPPAP
ncbi:hypothetical protein ACFL6B_01575 [Thermodesulfobacteriota bacterium]